MKILFVCIHNKRRSVMAEAFAKKFGLNAFSAGVEKTDGIDEKVVGILKIIEKLDDEIEEKVKELANSLKDI